MPIQVTLGDTKHSIGRRNVEDLLLYGKRTAIDRLSWAQKYIEDPFLSVLSVFTAAKTNKEILTELDMMIRQGQNDKRGADIVMGLAICSKAKDNNPKMEDFLSRLNIQVENNQKRVTLSIEGKDDDHTKEHKFAAPVLLPNLLFDETSGSYKLRPEVIKGPQLQLYGEFLTLFKLSARDEVIKIVNDLPKATSKPSFQACMLKLERLVAEDEKERFYQTVRFKIEQGNSCEENGGTAVRVLFSHGPDTLDLATIEFDKEFQPSKKLFEADPDSELSYKIQRHKFRDFFNLFEESDYQKVIGITIAMSKPNGSLAFEDNMLKLAQLVTKGQQEHFYTNLQLEVVEESGTSAVRVFFSDLPVVEARFAGKYIPNSRIFNAVEASEDNQTTHVFKLWEIDDNDNLRLPIDIKLNPTIRKNLQSIYDDLINTAITERQFVQMKKDLHRTVDMLPESSDDKDVLTKQKYRELVLTCFSNKDELIALTPEELEFHNKFALIPAAEKNTFLTQIETGKIEEAKMGLAREFLAFDSEKQARLKRTFFGVEKNLMFYGTTEQFKTCFLKMSNEDQALMVIAIEQDYKTPSKLLGIHFGANGPMEHQLAVCDSPYKIRRVKAPLDNSVGVEIKKDNYFKHNQDVSKSPVVIAHEEVSNTYSVSFARSQQIVGAKVKLFGSSSNLVIHNRDGSVSDDCPAFISDSDESISDDLLESSFSEEKGGQDIEFQLHQMQRNRRLNEMDLNARP